MFQKIKKAFYVASAVALVAPYTSLAAYGLEKVNFVETKGTTFVEVIANIIKVLLGFIGALSVLVIVIAGIMYITSGGDEG